MQHRLEHGQKPCASPRLLTHSAIIGQEPGMTASESSADKFGITARLFDRVSQMPKSRQLMLLEQLLGQKVRSRLYKLIVDMTEAQQIILLEQMGCAPEAELTVNTLNIEESDTSMREQPRKPCLINASYRIHDQTYKSYILDISIGGVYIESNAKFPVGQDVLLKFILLNQQEPFTLNGKIAWSSDKGFGVKFENINVHQSDILKSFIAQKD
jgi:Tfp pilus assembly protein PilZ